ncbi:NAD(+)/NADH kinase [Brachyspira aalborgi]|jgi:probable inorganic polyphosphate/ATP-NAD kinase|uniref:NAD kinase n=1 Tax=Brachyspira aalborgi TaxID=29522 RepID=A0AB38Q034_9SPIR|nr:NAD(+)/NADH kinase [Brachyspira aalborgi]MBS4763542.1 NAD(+)/NADH kinase [Brachyspira sp.]CCY74334.1 probable inorganic polyphosphate/ATP-NAD kinase [Brachyspira sp. CAG:700]TXJ16155.1 NAD(+)/NADH kinase [Brachyspira aalborgi]TXJ21786.1 NAD(+)/NADH kinase [Brachyspira aalborgi]TXJ26452.1 NAD(+)/NADH kinase [Brachyspira aalborgi]
MNKNKSENNKSVGIIINTLRGNPASILSKVKAILKKHRIETVIIDYDISSRQNINKARKILKNVSMLISIGGDGTLLSALKIAIKYNISVLPIYNGSLGFISEIPPDEAYFMLEEYLNNKKSLYEIESRTLLEVKLSQKKINKNSKIKKYLAVNELVLGKCDGRAIYIDVSIENKMVSSIVGDGVVIATPTGSTAYALSAGGPVLAPTIDAISFVPIAPHSLTFRPLVIPKGDTIQLELSKKSFKAMITIDGYDICKFDKNDILKAQISEKHCYIFQSAKRLFYDILRNKLKWGR